jgi:hypothetical protein
VVSFTLRPLYPQGKSPWYPLNGRLGGTQSRSGRGGEKKNSQPLPRLEPSIIQLMAKRYTTVSLISALYFSVSTCTCVHYCQHNVYISSIQIAQCSWKRPWAPASVCGLFDMVLASPFYCETSSGRLCSDVLNVRFILRMRFCSTSLGV